MIQQQVAIVIGGSFFKYRVRQISIKFGKKRSKVLREQELKLVQDIDNCCKKTPMSESDKNIFINLQSKLDEMYLRKARGAYVRSRAKWLEEGEKNTAYLWLRKKKTRKKCN